MRFFFKRWLDFETKWGDEQSLGLEKLTHGFRFLLVLTTWHLSHLIVASKVWLKGGLRASKITRDLVRSFQCRRGDSLPFLLPGNKNLLATSALPLVTRS